MEGRKNGKKEVKKVFNCTDVIDSTWEKYAETAR